MAQREGFDVNSSYICQFTEQEEDEEFGRQFNFVNLGEVSALELMKISQEGGPAVIVDVTDDAGSEGSEGTPESETKEAGEI